jgi:hypothetical protein
MFDSTGGLYESLFQFGAKRPSVGDDRDWVFGRSMLPRGERHRWITEILEHEPRHSRQPRIGQLALSDGRDLPGILREFGDRFLSRSQPLAPAVSFREGFRRQWYLGVAADGPLSQILLEAYADAMDGLLLIYDLSSWVLVNSPAVRPARSEIKLLRKPIPLDRLPKRIRMKLPPFSESLKLDVGKLRFAAPQFGTPCREDRFRIFGRTRATAGSVDFSEESVAGVAIPGQGVDELNSLNDSFLADATGDTRGSLNCRILIFAWLPKTCERNPNVKTIRFILEPRTGELHSVAYVRQSFLGFCEQTSGLGLAIGSALTGVQL